jgi:hypothetical protein
MELSGTGVAFTSYAIAAVIAMATALLMWACVKVINWHNARKEGKKE